MSHTSSGPELGPGRGKPDEPPPRPKKYREERTTHELCSGDFCLSCTDSETFLLAVAPTPAGSQQVKKRGDLARWTRRDWDGFLKKAEKFERADLIQELEKLKDATVQERIFQEKPVFDDDFRETPLAVHALLVHHSREKGYVRVRGTTTCKHRGELRSLGLRWNPSLGEWESGFSKELLNVVVKYVKENSEAYDPERIGYERCRVCARWKPIGTPCSCKSRPRT